MAQHLDFYRAHAPGFENAFLFLSAPQLGVRHARRLAGVAKMTRAQWPTGQVLDDEIGVTPSVSPKFPNISIPYGSLVPAQLEGLLACGASPTIELHGFMREIRAGSPARRRAGTRQFGQPRHRARAVNG
jgi:hypothetical protein